MSVRAAASHRSQGVSVNRDRSMFEQIAITDRPEGIGNSLASPASALAGPPIDRVKVDSIRRAIADGRYVIDFVKLAAAMIEQDVLTIR